MKSISDQFSDSVKEKLKKLDAGLEAILIKTGKAMVSEVRKLQDNPNKANGNHRNYATRNLSNSTNANPKKTKDGWGLTLGANAKNKGYSYGIVQEFGRKIGKFPDVDDLKKWVKKKVMLGHMTLPKEFGKNKTARIKTMAFLVGRSIKKKGIAPKLYYQKGFLAGNKLFQDSINDLIIEVFK